LASKTEDFNQCNGKEQKLQLPEVPIAGTGTYIYIHIHANIYIYIYMQIYIYMLEVFTPN